jgi:hypothetical protein
MAWPQTGREEAISRMKSFVLERSLERREVKD